MQYCVWTFLRLEFNETKEYLHRLREAHNYQMLSSYLVLFHNECGWVIIIYVCHN